jgi:hypothetical protein
VAQFGVIIEEIISISIDEVPHSDNEWKGIVMKKALSYYSLKNYIIKMIKSYQLHPNITFEDLRKVSHCKFEGKLNIIVWNCRRHCI